MYSAVHPAALFFTRRIPFSSPRSRKRLVSPGAGHGPGPLPCDGYPRAIVFEFLLLWHEITPLELFLVKQIALEYCAISGDEAALCVLWYLFGGAGWRK